LLRSCPVSEDVGRRKMSVDTRSSREMTPEERSAETDEQFIARLAARRKAREEAKKPKLTLTVSPKVAEAVKADPESVKVAVRAAEDVVVIERARPVEVVQVLEVDRDGRAALVRRFDCASGDESLIEMVGGYRPAPGVRHEYNPWDGLQVKGQGND
jgi:hypothetical protein